MQGFFSSKSPTSMILHRSVTLAQIAAGKSNAWIARNYNHRRSLIREICAAFDAEPSQIFRTTSSTMAYLTK
jgi:hypothetical protein